MEHDDPREWYDKIYKRPDSPQWYRSYTFGTKRYRSCLDTTNKDEAARTVRDEWEGFKLKARQAALLRDGVIQPEQVKRRPEMTLKQACDTYMAEREPNARATVIESMRVGQNVSIGVYTDLIIVTVEY